MMGLGHNGPRPYDSGGVTLRIFGERGPAGLEELAFDRDWGTYFGVDVARTDMMGQRRLAW